MEIATSRLSCKQNRETWTLHPLTDLHDGSPDHAKAELDERIAQIAADPRALWIGGGDYGDLILPNDPRFTGGVVDEDYKAHLARIPDYFLERMTERLWPIRDKCVGLAVGNHEATIGKYYHRGVGAELAMRLGCPEKYLGDRGWAIMQFSYGGRRMTLKAYQYHGWSAGRLKGRKALQAERDLGGWNANIFCLGHDHQPYQDIWYTEDAYASKNGWQIKQIPRAVLNGGSWTYGQKIPTPEDEKKGWTASTAPGQSWAEGKNFRPQPPANPVVLMHLDFGNGRNDQTGAKGRPMSYALETRLLGSTFHLGAVA